MSSKAGRSTSPCCSASKDEQPHSLPHQLLLEMKRLQSVCGTRHAGQRTEPPLAQTLPAVSPCTSCVASSLFCFCKFFNGRGHICLCVRHALSISLDLLRRVSAGSVACPGTSCCCAVFGTVISRRGRVATDPWSTPAVFRSSSVIRAVAVSVWFLTIQRFQKRACTNENLPLAAPSACLRVI